MFDELRFIFRIACEKAASSALGIRITPVHSFWYLTDPDYCLTHTPLITSESIGSIFDRLGLQGFYDEIAPNETIIFPDTNIKKANGHPPNFLTANYHASGCLATLSFVGQRHEIHVIAKCPNPSKMWHIDHIFLEEDGGAYELNCSQESSHSEAVESVLNIFYTTASIILLDPQAQQQDADVEVGKMLRDIFRHLDTQQAVARQQDRTPYALGSRPPL